MKNLFAYGTLMCEDIFSLASGIRHPETAAGILRGYTRHPVIGEVYPGILPKNKCSVQGIVYFNIPEKAWPLLDCFEGGLYERTVVRIECGNSKKITACTYVIRQRFSDRLDQRQDWDFQDFLAVGKRNFMLDAASIR